ncbi:MAG: HU family DNA-binding protein [Mycoplasmoidaceae bacterium]
MTKTINQKSNEQKPMSKICLVKKINEMTNLSPKEINLVLDTYESLINEEIKIFKEAKILNFGKVKITKTKARIGRNPATGAPINLSEKSKLKFVFFKKFKEFFSDIN